MKSEFSAGRRRVVQGIVSGVVLAPLVATAGFADAPHQISTTNEKPMFIVRDVFRCKPGKSKQVAEKFKKVFALTKGIPGVSDGKVMLDYVTSYWTVVLEVEVENLEAFEREMVAYHERADVQAAVAGYMDLVEEGHREIYHLV